MICKYDIDKHNPEFRLFIHAQALIKQYYYDLLKRYETIILVGFQQTPVTWFQKNICHNSENEYVVSYEYKEELKARLYDFNSNIKSIYEIFDNSKIHFKQDFYDIYGLIYHDFRTGLREILHVLI